MDRATSAAFMLSSEILEQFTDGTIGIPGRFVPTECTILLISTGVLEGSCRPTAKGKYSSNAEKY